MARTNLAAVETAPADVATETPKRPRKPRTPKAAQTVHVMVANGKLRAYATDAAARRDGMLVEELTGNPAEITALTVIG